MISLRCVILLAAVAVLGAAGARAADGVTAACQSAGSKTILQNEQVRVYERHGDLRACRYATKQRVDLASPGVAREFWYRRPAIKLVGPVVAYVIAGPTDPNEGDDITTIERLDLRDVSEPGFVNYRSVVAGPGIPKVGSLVFRADGAAAWITCPGRAASVGDFKPTCERPGHLDRVYTLGRNATKRKRVAKGTRIDPHSLRLRGSKLSWTQRGHRRSARL